ncbi:F-box protein PP2-B10-like [Trifolium pratense]|uniref:F-box protein PP2-B10-like n=1 Tax=Trifolium pratense TaxID=57577 RepID=UPI001E696CC1|nr:F-box protein PP2-B10-like [Trifolium pratense]
MAAFEDLPEGCISTILSRTTPLDAGRLSLISKTFHSAADSNAVWDQFLPSDTNFIDSIISQSPSLANIPTKKALYLALSDRPIIIDNGKKSFQLDRKSGKKCIMLAARSLSIVWGDDERYWNWIALPDSRFPEVAKLNHVWWLEIRGMINTLALSPNTRYGAYLVFKMIDAHGFKHLPVDLSVDVEGSNRSTKIVCLDPNVEPMWHMSGRRNRRWNRHNSRLQDRVVGLPRPNIRSDEWLEIEMGEFFNSGLEHDQVHMSVIETKAGELKLNFFVEGIEIRPKEEG